jgi:translation initiation factor 3 subunit E
LVQVKLRECEEVLENDYFLAALKEEFVENARLFIFETYCRIHQCIDLRMLAGALLSSAIFLHVWCLYFPAGGIVYIVDGTKVRDYFVWQFITGKLNMDKEAAEKWIVNLIRHARLNAKIDSQAGTVVMGMQFPSAYEQIMEKAKGLSQRTFQLANAVVGNAAA